MRRGISSYLFGLCVAALLATPANAQQVLEVIELNYRQAEEVIPMLRPMLAPGATLSGIKNKLIVRTTPANLAELRKILDVVDARPKRLVITVRQEEAAMRDSRDLEVAGTIGNDRARVTVPGTTAPGATVSGTQGDSRVRARVLATDSEEAGRNLQSVQVLEGNSAFIRLGESVPVQGRTTVIRPGAAATIDSTQYRDIETGFYATPRVSGDTATVQITAKRDSVLDRSTGAARIQSVDSVISGRLGEWIEVGSIVENADRTDTGTITYRSGRSTDRRRTFIKVEQLP